ncbi:hypothetical protein J19TS2_18520 [Cohnella xylanilytica]|uniref:glycosyltransferase family protein n=1 Tax=Cohnella xylanilytica TaxID=557555 RepID=UPI001B079BA3|nr:glycosyltransferase [Cohnella xylanilytica]GIO12297.1 hypothetical protein J19TS2_18520 [Cohnella xylanilytica]
MSTKVYDLNHPFNGQIILFKGQSQYDVLRSFIDGIYDALRQLGHRPVVIDLTDSDVGMQLERVLQQPVFFALGINGMGIELKYRDQSLFDAAGFPFFAFLVDHPFHHARRLQFAVHNLIVSCIDEYHVAYLREYFPELVCTRAFIPHCAASKESSVPISDRKYDVVFAGTYTDPDQARGQWADFDPHLRDFLDDVAERALYDSTRPLIGIMQDLLVEKGLGENRIYLQKLTSLLAPLDLYVRNRRRKEMVESILDLPVHVFGNGWDSLPFALGRKIHIHPSISFTALQKVMCDTKIMLSLLPNFQYGGHERLFTAMLNGAVVLADSNAYLEKHLISAESIHYFRLDSLKMLPERIEGLLGDPVRLQEVASSGKNAVQQGHLWLHRTAQIVETVKYHYSFYPLK